MKEKKNIGTLWCKLFGHNMTNDFVRNKDWRTMTTEPTDDCRRCGIKREEI